MGAYFRRFKTDALNILGHYIFGLLAAFLGGNDGIAFLMGGWAYQFGSGYRKAVNTGETDTIGLDCVDYALAFFVGVTIRFILAMEGVPGEFPHLTP